MAAALELKVENKEDEKVTELVNSEKKITEEKMYEIAVKISEIRKEKAKGIEKEVEEILGELEMTEPNNSDVMFTLAIVCSQLGEHEKSIYYYSC